MGTGTDCSSRLLDCYRGSRRNWCACYYTAKQYFPPEQSARKEQPGITPVLFVELSNPFAFFGISIPNTKHRIVLRHHDYLKHHHINYHQKRSSKRDGGCSSIRQPLRHLGLPLDPIPEERAVMIEASVGTSSSLEMLQLANLERQRRGLSLLQPSKYLNAIAQRHADAMAQQEVVTQSAPSARALQSILNSAIVGENVQRGDSLAHLHENILHNNVTGITRSNLLSPYYREHGAAVAVAKDGKTMYACHLFRSDATTSQPKIPPSTTNPMFWC